MKSRFLLLSVSAALLCACEVKEGAGEFEDFASEYHSVSGKIEKGPMIRGSVVDMRTLDRFLVPSGASYTTNIENNKGEFSFGELKIDSPYAKLTANGFFFNEVKGELSVAPISLDAIVDLSESSSINVNVLTHLVSQRIVRLVNGYDKSFAEANRQAREELLAQFGLQEYSGRDVSQFSIASGDDAAAALIVISSYILADRSEAEIVEFLSALSSEFAREGKFSDESMTELKETRKLLNGNIESIAENIVNRYKDLGFVVSVERLESFIDWDDDGVAGNEIGEGEVKLSQDRLDVPSEGGEYSIIIDSDYPCYLEMPDTAGSSDNVWADDWQLYEGAQDIRGISYSKFLEGNTLTIKISPALFLMDKTVSVNLYDVRGKAVATIEINQKGNPDLSVSVPELGRDAGTFVGGMMTYLRYGLQELYNLEWNYISAERKEPFSPSSSGISKAWENLYSSLNTLLSFKNIDAQRLGCYQPFADVYASLLYYELSSKWGAVPFVSDRRQGDGPEGLTRLSESAVLANIAGLLESALPKLEEKANDSRSSVNSVFFVSRDVARVLLAYTYCNLNVYDKAAPLLEAVVNNGFYSLVKEDLSVLRTGYHFDSQCIMGLVYNTKSRISFDGELCIPCLDYAEVLLTYAECLSRLGREEEAGAIIRSVSEAKNLPVEIRGDKMEAIFRLRSELKSPHTLVFVRRQNLGESCIGLQPSELYQLLLPVPLQELQTNPNLTQNEGY